MMERMALDEQAAAPTGPLATLASMAGLAGRARWLGSVLAGVSLAACWWLVSPTLAKLLAALLLPLAAAACLAWIARWLPAALDRWITAWLLAAAALALALAGLGMLRTMGFTPQELVAYPSGDLIARTVLVWLCCVAAPLVVQQRQQHRNEMAALRLSALSAELKALQAQVEPHFLYNTLANARYLARHQPERAVEMLDHLIVYLHQALPDMRSRTSDVVRECELARHYLALMAIRFGERLRYTVTVDDTAGAAEMPPLLLMSLVENAVRHGVEATPDAVEVSLSARLEGDALHLCVTDSGPGPGDTVLGSGVGLRNVRERLQALYGGRASFALTRGADDLTRAELVLPCQAPLVSSNPSKPR
jgi:signal transduction histidine kinase